VTVAAPERERLGGTDGNERLTGATGIVLAVLLAAEGITILWLRSLRVEHMFVGVLLIPPLALKLSSTGYRFARYYTGERRYRAKGPPLLALRLLAPVLAASTVTVIASGVALMLAGHHSDLLLLLHKGSFIVWSACFAVHFLWYLPRALRALLAGRLPGAVLRGGLVGAALGGGLLLALALLSRIEAWHGR
jgi:hypothetical protein